MRITTASALLLSLGVLGCASGATLPVAEPGIQVRQLTAPAFVQERGGLFSVGYQIQVENRADVPITAQRIEMQTVAGGPYTIRPIPIEIGTTIEAGETEVLEVSAWAYSSGGQSAAFEPVTLRMAIRFLAKGEPFQVMVIRRVEQK